MPDGPEKPGNEPLGLDLSAILTPSNASSSVDFDKKLGFSSCHIAPLGRDMIEQHDVSHGVYNVYTRMIPQGELYRCEVDECTGNLLEVRCAIEAVMETDGTWYTLNSLAKEPAIHEALLTTNRKAIICLEHKAAAVFVTGEQPAKDLPAIIPITRGLEIRVKKKRKKAKKNRK